MKKEHIKQKMLQTYLSLRERSRRYVAFILSLDIDVLFWFALSYIVFPNLTLLIRIVGMIGWTYIYKLLVKDVHGYGLCRRSNK